MLGKHYRDEYKPEVIDSLGRHHAQHWTVDNRLMNDRAHYDLARVCRSKLSNNGHQKLLVVQQSIFLREYQKRYVKLPAKDIVRTGHRPADCGYDAQICN